MKLNKLLFFSVTAIFLYGCAAIKALPEARHIELVNEAPDANRCEYLGEVSGSQGNWLTGDLTPNENLVVGARNDLRNKAYKMGGNLVYIQDMKNTNAYESLGTTNTKAIGKVYRCQK